MLNDPQDSNNSSPFYAEEPVVITTENGNGVEDDHEDVPIEKADE
jgi:hypothetical protein